MMQNHRSMKPILKMFLWLLVLAAAWLLIAPIQLGGRLFYLIVTGNSMFPTMHNGDLAIMQPSDEYVTGDVVIYQHPDLGPVIHRIIAYDGERYLIKGDNNEWEDSYLPTASEISGKLWLKVPYAGKIFRGFRSPVGAAMLAGIIGLFLFWPDSKQEDER